jgi:hypothetical protein
MQGLCKLYAYACIGKVVINPAQPCIKGADLRKHGHPLRAGDA